MNGPGGSPRRATDPTGRSFLCYPRRREADAALLVAAQHEVGIPTWQDVHDLGPGKVEREIRRLLTDPATADAVLWITPEVAGSSFLCRIEIPEVLRRDAEDDGFFCQAVAAGGLDWQGAARVVDGAATSEDLRSWNIHETGEDELSPAGAAEVARRVLRQRLLAIDRHLPPGEPLRLGFFTREPIRVQPATALVLDWTHRFGGGREAEAGAWEEALLPALRTVVSEIGRSAPGRAVEAYGNPALPAAFALGAALLAPKRVGLTWLQYFPEGVEKPFSLTATADDPGFRTRVDERDPSANDLALLLSVSDDVTGAFAHTRSQLPKLRGVIEVTGPPRETEPGERRSPLHRLETGGQAAALAQQVAGALRDARGRLDAFGTLHVFASVPAGLAVLVGQLLNTFDRVQTYELLGEPEAEARLYRPAALLRPNR